MLSSSVDKMTTGTYNFASVSSNVGALVLDRGGLALESASRTVSSVIKQF